MDKYDFSGWATRSGIQCTDGRTIVPDAFKGNDNEIVPLVWMHQHNTPENTLGHALLKNKQEGVYAYCSFNDSESGKTAKELVDHGDITKLSIYANRLQQHGGRVMHGEIREVSLVIAGANPGAFIDSVVQHADGMVESEDEAIIYSGEELELCHSDLASSSDNKKKEENMEDTTNKDEQQKSSEDSSEETISDVFNTLSDKQKKVVYALVQQAIQDNQGKPEEDENPAEEDQENNEGEQNMKHNAFEQNNQSKEDKFLSHDDMQEIIGDAKTYGSLRESVLAHGITDIDYLFPDAKTMSTAPALITREQEWVSAVMSAIHHTPFSRIKSMFANLTEDEARAKGYMKGKQKKEEVFGLLKRTTTPTTIYKKQRLDRDDMIDITDFDVVAWLKTEMRMMLDEEIARAILVGDGRLTSSDDKVNEQNIRPIWTDDNLYTIKTAITVASGDTDDVIAKNFIRAAIKARTNYKGTGSPVLYTTEDTLTDCLLMEDKNGRVIYDSVDKLATALRVSKILTVPVMEGLTRTDSEDSKVHTLMGIVVNLADYNVGADKGGSVSMFDDFDIDYNQQKYLIETRCSGALTVPYSAIAIESVPAA